MKKLCILTLILVFALSLTAFGADITVQLNGETIDARDVNGNPVEPFIEDGTTYLPVRAIATALDTDVRWDGETKTVFLGNNGDVTAQAGEQVNVYVNGIKLNPTDANGKAVAPILRDGTTYLPVRAIAQAFAKKVDWDGETSTVLLSDSAKIDETKTYKITLHGTNSVITPSGDGSGSALVTALFSGSENQIWKFIPVDGGFYQIVNLASGCGIDVNGASKAAGAKLLQYNLGTGENQKYMLVAQENGAYKIYSKNSMLPFEASAGDVKQNIDRESGVQLWDIVEAYAVPQAETKASYVQLVDKSTSLALTYSTDANALTAKNADSSESQLWALVPTTKGTYAVNTKNGGRSIDVANNSTTSGDPIITYASSEDDNQRWVFEKQEDGGYKVKSVHSELYLTVNADGSVTQTENGSIFVIQE